MSLFVYLLQIYIYTAYTMYIYLYLIRFFNWNLARICQEVASPFELFLMWFISTRAKKYAQTVGGIWSYIQRYIHTCVCVCVLPVCQLWSAKRASSFWLAKWRENQLPVWECDRVHDHAGEDTCARQERARERENWELRTDLAFANCWKCQSKLRNSAIHNSRISSKTS